MWWSRNNTLFLGKTFNRFLNIIFIGALTLIILSLTKCSTEEHLYKPEGVPIALAGNDTTISIKDTVSLKGEAFDNDGSINKWQWKINDGEWITTNSGHTTILPSDTPTVFICSLMVTDNDGFASTDDIIISVVQDIPICIISTTSPTLSINDTIQLIGTSTDKYGTIVKWEWKFGNSDWSVTSDGVTSIIAPSSPNNTYPCILKVTDDDGNSAIDTITFNVLLDPPLCTASTTTPIVSINDTIIFQGATSDLYGTIVKWEWDIGNTGTFIEATIDSNYTTVAPSNANSSYQSIFKITDNDGNISLDTISINVLLDLPSCTVTTTTPIVSINDTIKFQGVASDLYGTIVKWEWDIGNTGTFIEATIDSNYITVAPSNPNSSYQSIFKATDNDGNISLDTISINVLLDLPSCTVSTTTPTVSTNDTITLQGSTTNEYGNIKKYEWKFGSYDWIVSSTIDTVIIAPSTDQFYSCSLKVTDDDGLVAFNSIEIIVGQPTITDIDGNVYNTITIGTQIWLKENLRTTKYNDGTPIPNLESDIDWLNDIGGAYCYYDNIADQDSIIKNGALYNWYAVNTGKLAPPGWHVTTDDDWNTLAYYLIDNGYNWGGQTTGNMLGKSIATKEGWYPYPNEGAVGNNPSTNDSSGFSGVPAGARGEAYKYGAVSADFIDKGSYAMWWMVDKKTTDARSYYIDYYQPYLMLGWEDKAEGHSVRLVRD